MQTDCATGHSCAEQSDAARPGAEFAAAQPADCSPPPAPSLLVGLLPLSARELVTATAAAAEVWASAASATLHAVPAAALEAADCLDGAICAAFQRAASLGTEPTAASNLEAFAQEATALLPGAAVEAAVASAATDVATTVNLAAASFAELTAAAAAASSSASEAFAAASAALVSADGVPGRALPPATLVLGTARGRLLLWRCCSEAADTTLNGGANGGDDLSSVTALTLVGESLVAAGSAEGSIQLWQLRAEGESPAARRIVASRSGAFHAPGASAAHFGAVSCLLSLYDGRGDGCLLSLGGSDGSVKLWRVATGDCAIGSECHEGGAVCGTLLGCATAVSGGADSALCFWCMSGMMNGALSLDLVRRVSWRSPVSALFGLPDGRCAVGDVCTRSSDGGCLLSLLAADGEVERTVALPSPATTVAGPLGGRIGELRVAVGCADAHICIVLAEPRPRSQPDASQPVQIAAPALLLKACDALPVTSIIVLLSVIGGPPSLLSLSGSGVTAWADIGGEARNPLAGTVASGGAITAFVRVEG